MIDVTEVAITNYINQSLITESKSDEHGKINKRLHRRNIAKPNIEKEPLQG